MNRNIRQLGLTCWAAAALLGAHGPPAQAASVSPKTLEATAHDAGAVFVGRVLGHQTRWGNAAHTWMHTDYVFLVEEALVPAPGVQKGRTVTLNFWGGALEQERQEIAGVAPPQDGERSVVMLRSDWQNPGFTPVVGLCQGLFHTRRDAATGREVLADAGGAPILKAPGGRMVRGLEGEAQRPDHRAVTLEEFVGALRTGLPRMRAMVVKPEAVLDPRDPRVLKTFALQPEAPGARVNAEVARAEDLADAVLPAGQEPASGPGGPLPARDPGLFHSPAAPGAAAPAGPAALTLGAAPDGRTGRWVHRSNPPDWPIVINQFTASMAPWSPEDQRQIAKWNYYCDVFRVRDNPTGTYGYPNARNDMAGFLSSTALARTYGRGWNAGEQAVTFTRSLSGGKMIESDIIFNAGRTWTLDDESVYNGGGADSFRQTLVHELGHVFGAQHDFNVLSVMNYAPAAYRGYAMPYTDDAENIRVQYGSHNVRHTDLGVSLYRSNGYQNWQDATFPAQVTAGERITVGNYRLENVGTETVTQPRVEWFLSPARNSNPGTLFYPVGVTTYPALARNEAFDPASVARTLTVPQVVRAGKYYLCAYLRGDGNGGIPGNLDNNHGWSRTQITVVPRLVSVLISPSPIPDQSTGTGRVTLSSPPASGSISVTLLSSNPSALGVPASVTVPAGAASATFPVTTYRLDGPTTVRVRAAYIGPQVVTSVLVVVAGDAYEHDAWPAEAKRILPGQTQYHSIHRTEDEDWAWFQLSVDAVVNVVTWSGSAANIGDTELWLYAADGVTQVDYNDDTAETHFAHLLGRPLPAGRYYVRVRSYNNRSVLPTYALTFGIRPAAPSGLAATAVSPTRVDLAWADNSDNESSFEIERNTGGQPYTRIATVGARVISYSDTTVAPETTYTYRVRAVNNFGPSAYSDEAEATTPAAVVYYQVSGTVTYYSLPLEGAEVHAAGQTVVTGADGTYTFRLPAGTVTVGISYSGPLGALVTGPPRTLDLQADVTGVDFFTHYN